MNMGKEYVVGIDVGTGSVRVGIFDLGGRMIGYSQKDIQLWRPQENFVEQSSSDIWSATCFALKEALRRANLDPAAIIGISFDATCSLVVLDDNDDPLRVSQTGNADRNIIVWMDHRAMKQCGRINRLKHKVLQYVGGRISPEMEPPKLLWIKENLPDTWKRAAKFLDLADFMTYKCTGIDVRSLCTTVCKWTYLAHENGWDRNFFRQLGMEKLLNGQKIGTKVLPMGTSIANLTRTSAEELGLTTNTKVAVGIIDAHAGGLGVMGLDFERTPRPAELEKILALIGGTSSCHIVVSRKPRFMPGIWGPYYSAMIPGMWLVEGGQSATGSLIDFTIRENSAFESIKQNSEKEGITIYQYLNNIIDDIKQSQNKGPEIVKDINILPYFYGNRSPRADPTLNGVVSGLALATDIGTVARKYYATIQAIAYGTRHIIEVMNKHGYKIRKIHACGGGTKNPLWLQEHADITECEIVIPKESEAVVLGSAILAAIGAGKYSSVPDAMAQMSSPGERFLPKKRYAQFHRRKYKVFQQMYDHFMQYRRILSRF